jgi:hypothetical protein
MKTLGVFLIAASVAIGFISDNYINSFLIEPFVALAFCFFLLGIYILIQDNNGITRK